LEAVPLDHEGKPMVMLRDTEQGAGSAFVLSPAGMLLASLLNGRRALGEVKALFIQRTGMDLQEAEILQLVQMLERNGLLDTPDVQAARQAQLDRYLASPLRPPAHVGGGYPTDRLALTKFLTAFFTDPKGPRETRSTARTPLAQPPPTGLIAPHIDFHRGGPAYAWAYRALADFPPPDVIVALGVAHASPNSPWVMTRKGYDTPFGPVEVHEDLAGAIANQLWYDPLEEELVHRREHSLEFQAVWLKYLWGDKAPQWVPLLTSTFERFAPDQAPSSVPQVEKAIAGIGRLLARRAKAGERILILGGVDFAHVGPRFGDQIVLSPEVEKRIEDEDRASFEAMNRLDADAFYLTGVGPRSWRKVCGLSATYTALRWIRSIDPERKGSFLTYGQAPDPLGGIVSFASMLF
jgi:MEMO1 family protein